MNENNNLGVSTTYVGGMAIARQSRREAAEMFAAIVAGDIELARSPAYITSANGQVLSQYAADPAMRPLFDAADLIHADGQPMVAVSRLLSSAPLPERCATTDLYHDVSATLPAGSRYFLLGASEEEILRAVERTRQLYPHIHICGWSHGYLDERDEEATVKRINALAPDVLWIGLGSPREQAFVMRHRGQLANLKIIKTSGGLFNFLSGTRSRAPAWMQGAGLEWLYRLALEPRRLMHRYLTTNARSLALLFTRTK